MNDSGVFVMVISIIMIIVAVAGTGLACLYDFYRIKIKKAALRYIREHASLLARKRMQLLMVDDYGIVDDRQWAKHMRYIVDIVIPRHLEDDLKLYVAKSTYTPDVYIRCIEDTARDHQNEDTVADLSTVITGEDYEHECARILRSVGWQARVTKATGDQGVDVIAEGAGRRVVLQCKYYAQGRTVGNHAVMEVRAAQDHEQADHAVVVAPVPFTRSARQLATTTGVMLLHHDALPELATMLGIAEDCEP
jgi:restriction system protein